MRILHVVTTVNPDAGGVAESILVRGRELIRMGHEVEVVSLDSPDARFAEKYPLTLHALGPGFTPWNFHRRLSPWLRSQRDRFDMLVVEGIWQYHGLAVRNALRGSDVPYFVFPHGMLDPWFKRQYPLKHIKKWMIWPWADYRVLRDARSVLFTCALEAKLAKESFWLYQARPIVVPFGTAPPPPTDGTELAQLHIKFRNLRGRRFILYLGRVHPKKGCDMLIQAFEKFSREHPDIDLVIAGPAENSFKKVLVQRIAEAGIDRRVHWMGPVQGTMKWAVFRASELFVLPSHQENFGIAVVEAMACGVPVLITNKVNIWPEVNEAGGIVVNDTPEDLERGLFEWAAEGAVGSARRSNLGREGYRRSFSVAAMAQSLVDLAKSDG